MPFRYCCLSYSFQVYSRLCFAKISYYTRGVSRSLQYVSALRDSFGGLLNFEEVNWNCLWIKTISSKDEGSWKNYQLLRKPSATVSRVCFTVSNFLNVFRGGYVNTEKVLLNISLSTYLSIHTYINSKDCLALFLNWAVVVARRIKCSTYLRSSLKRCQFSHNSLLEYTRSVSP